MSDVLFEDVKPTGNSLIIDLPTKGILYPETHPFYKKEKITAKKVSGEEIDIVTNLDLIKNGKVIDSLLKACITERGFNPDDLYGVDKDVLTYHLRISGLGYDYTPYSSVQCPKCQQELDSYTFQITKAKYEDLDDYKIVDFELGGKQIKVVETEYNGDVILYRFLTSKDWKVINDQDEKSKKITGRSQKSIHRFVSQVVSINSTVDKFEIEKYFRSLSLEDAYKILQIFKEPEFMLQADFICPKCSHEEVKVVDYDFGFLLPRNIFPRV